MIQRLCPSSQLWLAYWDRQVFRYMSSETDVHLTLAGVRAAMQHDGEPGALVGGITGDDECGI